MRDLAVAKLEAATKSPRPIGLGGAGAASAWIEQNGGLPPGGPSHVVALDAAGREVALPANGGEVKQRHGGKLFVTYESEPGLTIPGILWLPDGAPRAAVVLVADAGKSTADLRFTVSKLLLGGIACFAIDPRGFGELSGLDLRLLVYRNQAPAFAAAVDVQRAVEIVRPLAAKVAVVGDGPAASLAALAAAHLTRDLGAVVGRDAMHEFADAFSESIPLLAIQPQADLLPPLSKLRADLQVPALWNFPGDRAFDLFSTLLRLNHL